MLPTRYNIIQAMDMQSQSLKQGAPPISLHRGTFSARVYLTLHPSISTADRILSIKIFKTLKCIRGKARVVKLVLYFLSPMKAEQHTDVRGCSSESFHGCAPVQNGTGGVAKKEAHKHEGEQPCRYRESEHTSIQLVVDLTC